MPSHESTTVPLPAHRTGKGPGPLPPHETAGASLPPHESTDRLDAPATATAPALLLRPWEPADAAPLAELYRDEALRRFLSHSLTDEADAARWIEQQRQGREAGGRFAFAVVESAAPHAAGRLVGHAVVKGVAPGSPAAEVGYWTAAHARGRGVAPRALEALTGWAFAAFAAQGLTRLELVHQADNTASCRVAHKCAYELTGTLPAAPPAHPLDGHVHTRTPITGAGPRSA
ncbi:GNAT family N-acetyltransferase [Streptomyces sp. NRRL S-340]|uniref:GNAT family N-acetyltransferase n=1 Tax=Streptomyces sp. NRRL S-340 TaxID=1463901 RepID=UPI00099C34B8|nr:GNAT family N-acetyltransferase [Streptomyces sp. NRRL S-340]